MRVLLSTNYADTQGGTLLACLPGLSKAVTVGFGDRLRELRAFHGYSQRELGDLANVSHGYISQLETGSSGPPSKEVLESLARVLEVPPTDLFAAAGYAIAPPSEDDFFAAEMRDLTPDERKTMRTFLRGLKAQRDLYGPKTSQ